MRIGGGSVPRDRRIQILGGNSEASYVLITVATRLKEMMLEDFYTG